MTDTPAPVSAEAPAPDLAIRLRGKWQWPPSATMEEAADAIDHLTAENKHLKAIEAAYDDHEREMIDLEEEVVRQAATIERLRAALKNIKWQSVDKDNMEFEARITCFQMDNIRAALKEDRT